MEVFQTAAIAVEEQASKAQSAFWAA